MPNTPDFEEYKQLAKEVSLIPPEENAAVVYLRSAKIDITPPTDTSNQEAVECDLVPSNYTFMKNNNQTDDDALKPNVVSFSG